MRDFLWGKICVKIQQMTIITKTFEKVIVTPFGTLASIPVKDREDTRHIVGDMLSR